MVLIQLDQSAVESHNGPHEIVSIGSVSLLHLLQSLDLYVESFFLGNFSSSEVV
jgi:hypothetical protein